MLPAWGHDGITMVSSREPALPRIVPCGMTGMQVGHFVPVCRLDQDLWNVRSVLRSDPIYKCNKLICSIQNKDIQFNFNQQNTVLCCGNHSQWISGQTYTNLFMLMFKANHRLQHQTWKWRSKKCSLFKFSISLELVTDIHTADPPPCYAAEHLEHNCPSYPHQWHSGNWMFMV